MSRKLPFLETYMQLLSLKVLVALYTSTRLIVNNLIPLIFAKNISKTRLAVFQSENFQKLILEKKEKLKINKKISEKNRISIN